MGANSQISQPIIFFDGVCNLCNSSVNFVIDRDPHGKFKFAALQSEVAKKVLASTNIQPQDLESIVFFDGNQAFRKSRAALEVARRMRGLWPLLYVFIVVPGFLRDVVYDFIARNRYKWFGKQVACRIPTPELKSRFLDS